MILRDVLLPVRGYCETFEGRTVSHNWYSVPAVILFLFGVAVKLRANID